MKVRTDFEGEKWASGNHKWKPIHPVATMAKCIHCERIELKKDIKRGGLSKCEWRIK